MQKIILGVLLAFLGWWFMFGSRQLDADNVDTYYFKSQKALAERKPKEMCELLDKNFLIVSTTVTAGKTSAPSTQDRQQTCDGYDKMFDAWTEIGAQMGGLVQLDTDYTIHRVQISEDKKTATVEVTSDLRVAGSLMRFRSRSTDTLIRRNGKVLMLTSKGTVVMSTGS